MRARTSSILGRGGGQGAGRAAETLSLDADRTEWPTQGKEWFVKGRLERAFSTEWDTPDTAGRQGSLQTRRPLSQVKVLCPGWDMTRWMWPGDIQATVSCAWWKDAWVGRTRRTRFRRTRDRHGDGASTSFTEAQYKSPTVRQGSEPKFLSQNHHSCDYTRKAFLLLFHFNHLNQVYPQTMLF